MCKQERFTYDEFEKRCYSLWGKRWRQRFFEVVDITPRTMSRWKFANMVSNGPVCAMIVAFEKMKFYGLMQQVDWER
jgi:hypothetical protein